MALNKRVNIFGNVKFIQNLEEGEEKILNRGKMICLNR